MPKLTITLTHLEEWKDGLLHGVEVAFKAIRSGVVLVEDTVSGKCSSPYSRSYVVESAPGYIVIEHDRPDIHGLIISAALDG